MIKKTLSIVGVTLTGNMGGQAMLFSTIQNIKKKIPEVSFNLLSIYPQEDNKFNYDQVNVVELNPKSLILLYLPLSLLVCPFANFSSFRKLLMKNAYFASLLSSEAVIDLGGITFIDGRGLALLFYNIACTLPGILFKIPTFKLSQAMGPFNQILNRFFASKILKKCQKVVARGEITLGYLQELKLNNIQMNYDTAFCLEVDNASRKKAHDIIEKLQLNEKTIIISPSQVVENECKTAGVDFREEILKTIDEISKRNLKILLLAHSLRKEVKSKNNDIELCEFLYNKAKLKDKKVFLVPHQEDSRILREIIGSADLFIGCRFHSIVSALSKGVPTIALAWSHKYLEMINPFGIDQYVLNIAQFNSENLLDLIDNLENNKMEVRNSLDQNLQRVVHSSRGNFKLIINYLSTNKL